MFKLEKGKEKDIKTNCFTVKSMIFFIMMYAHDLKESEKWIDDEMYNSVMQLINELKDNSVFKEITESKMYQELLSKIL